MKTVKVKLKYDKYLDINFSPTKNYIGAMEGL